MRYRIPDPEHMARELRRDIQDLETLLKNPPPGPLPENWRRKMEETIEARRADLKYYDYVQY